MKKVTAPSPVAGIPTTAHYQRIAQLFAKIEQLNSAIWAPALALILCLSLTSCGSLWLAAYRYKGRDPQRPSQPTLEEAAENMKLLTGREQPTYH